MTVRFETGWGSYGILDWWAVIIAVEGGSTPGTYQNSGRTPFPHWKECQLQSADVDQNLSNGPWPSRPSPAFSHRREHPSRPQLPRTRPEIPPRTYRRRIPPWYYDHEPRPGVSVIGSRLQEFTALR